MKKITMTVIFLLTGVCNSALAQKATGYVYLDGKNKPYFAGLSDKLQPSISFSIDYALNVQILNKSQLLDMQKCQLNKNTHAIEVSKIGTFIIKLPTGAPLEVQKLKVKCVSALGFINIWRSKMGASSSDLK